MLWQAILEQSRRQIVYTTFQDRLEERTADLTRLKYDNGLSTSGRKLMASCSNLGVYED